MIHVGRMLMLCCWLAAWSVHGMAIGQENQCAVCHGTEELWEADTRHLYVKPEDLANDVHHLKGITCYDCHGGDPNTFQVNEAHAVANGFRVVKTPADVPDFCGRCHSDAQYMQKHRPDAKTDIVERFWQSAHGKFLDQTIGRPAANGGDAAANGDGAADPAGAGDVQPAVEAPDKAAFKDPRLATCTSCHNRHGMLPVTDPQSLSHPTRLAEACGKCHQEQRNALLIDVHAEVRVETAEGTTTGLSCQQCHGDDVHGMLPVKEFDSPVFVHNQLESCGKCHEKSLATYRDSVHGHGLERSGLLTTATCSSCHGAHGVFPAKHEQSTLHTTKVAATCGACHLFIEDRLMASVHGQGAGPGGLAERSAPGGEKNRKPSCTDCHQGHDLPDPSSEQSRLNLMDRCGSCHEDLTERYRMSLHGQLTNLGNAAAAKCSDCHGAHDILPIHDASSRLAGENRVKTCAQCHPRANLNFAKFDPHADHHDPNRSPVLYYAFVGMETLLYSVFGFFGVHTLLWFGRSWVHRIRHGMPQRLQPGGRAFVRFDKIHRTLHLMIIVSFLGLALTGLPLKYSAQPWAKWLATALGGFESTSFWHRICALITAAYFIIHLGWLTGKINQCRRDGMSWKRIFFGPDSTVPNLHDFVNIFQMGKWFVGLGPKPTFDRWTYWEKFDYWAVFWGVGIIGVSGLILWFPEFFCLFLPGVAINIAKIIHSEEALLATGFIFTIHFFNTHLRAEKFPMDMSMLTGLVTEEELADERREFVSRMNQAGKLSELEATVPSRRSLILRMIGGFLAVAIGLALLFGMLVAMFD